MADFFYAKGAVTTIVTICQLWQATVPILSSHGIQAAPWSRISAMTRVLGANPILLPSRFLRQGRLAVARRIFYPLTAVVQSEITTLVSTYQLTGNN